MAPTHASVVKARDSQLHDQAGHQATAARQHGFDVITTGDLRVTKEIQHYCSGMSCCPNGVPDTIRKLRGKQGIMGMLRRIGIWPRKSWHGQAESCSHIMQLEVTHGIISGCFRPIAASAKLRAMLAYACLENQKQRRASKMELDDL